MVPQAILEQLGRVRRRQQAVSVAWGAARLLAVATAALLVGGLVDWLVDLRTDTPGSLRLLFLAGHLGLWIGATAAWIVRPLLRRPSDADVALWAEATFPEYGHRLITTVELNRDGAATAGMSAELIAAVTRQAGEMAGRTDLASRVDARPLRRGALAAVAAAATVVIAFLAAPETAPALLSRQFLADREIPRSVRVEAETGRLVKPAGEELKLRFRAKGRAALEMLAGSVEVRPADRDALRVPLVFESKSPEGGAIFSATVPPGSIDFDYRAWLRDGRTRRAASIAYEPRPVVQKIDAWVLLPRYCGLRPDGTPYEQARLRGEIAGPTGSSARLEIEVQKPVVRARLELLGRPGGEASPEQVLRKIELVLLKEGRAAEGRFELQPGETAYRVLVEDRNGFANALPPKRGIAILPDEPPRVVLLPERFGLPGESGLSEDAEVEGMPIPLGSSLRIAYYAAHPFGLDRARLQWRIVKAGQASEEGAPALETGWKTLPLGEVRQTEASGAFDLRRGVFENTGFRDQVEFHPLPSPDPARILGRTEGGGCFDFQTRPLTGLQPGDQIEFFIEAFARNPELEKSPGRSETRLKAFVTQPQFVDWVLQTLRHESRVRALESRQRGVFAPEGVNR